MYDPKEKALGGIEVILEKRMGSRLKPKKAPAEEAIAPEEIDTADENGEGAPMEGMEGHESPLEEKVEQAGGDIERLSPEEKDQLKMLYEKMGC